jgi:hypothetical protein
MNASRSRSLTSLYVAGPFSMGYVDFYTFLIPLYGLSLGFDASEVGILVGARSVVAMGATGKLNRILVSSSWSCSKSACLISAMVI